MGTLVAYPMGPVVKQASEKPIPSEIVVPKGTPE